MSKDKRVVYSTDPEEEKAAAPVVLPSNPAAALNAQKGKPVRVWLDKKGRGGKTVCVIKGVISPKAGKQALVKHLKNKLGTGGAVKGDELEIQGDHREKIVAMLRELGYEAKAAGG